MNSKVEQYIISSGDIATYLFIVSLEHVYDHLSAFRPKTSFSQNKVIRVCYLIIVENLGNFIRIQDQLSTLKQFQNYQTNLIPFENRKQMEDHIKMMEKMNETQFEDQYVQMLDLLEKEIDVKLVREFCMKELRWSESKVASLIEREGVNTVNKLLNYRSFNQLQNAKIREIWDFIQNYLSNQELN